MVVVVVVVVVVGVVVVVVVVLAVVVVVVGGGGGESVVSSTSINEVFLKNATRKFSTAAGVSAESFRCVCAYTSCIIEPVAFSE